MDEFVKQILKQIHTEAPVNTLKNQLRQKQTNALDGAK